MVRAIRERRKTQTRRLVTPQPIPGVVTQDGQGHRFLSGSSLRAEHLGETEWRFAMPGYSAGPWRCPYGQVGDRLWVRESFADIDGVPWYRADSVRDDSGDRDGWWSDFAGDGVHGIFHPGPIRWTPSIHMPRRFCRLVLEVSGVRVERVQDISAADARAEGVRMVVGEDGTPLLNISVTPKPDCAMYQKGRDASVDDYWIGNFALLWNEINLKRAPWDENPWVWVVEFRLAYPEDLIPF
jgi:hypothetical protein